MKRLRVVAIATLLFAGSVGPASAGFFDNSAYLSAVRSDENGDYVAAHKKFLKLVSSSDTSIAGNSAFKLYEYYDNGRGVPRNSAVALRYLKEVLRVGNEVWQKIALQKLSMLHEQGIEGALPISLPAAYSYALEAAALGADMATTIKRLSLYPEVVYSTSEQRYSAGVNEVAPAGFEAGLQAASKGNLKLAEEVFVWHAKRGNSDAQYALSLILRGRPDNQARIDAVIWGYLSARNGVAASQREYGEYLIRETYVTLPEAFAWLERAAAQGDGRAVGLMGDFRLLTVKGVQPDPRAAAQYFDRGVKLGDVGSAVRLADLYYQGLGVSEDKAAAYHLYTDAAQAGNLAAKAKLVAFYPAGAPTKKSAGLIQGEGISRLPVNSQPLTPAELYEAVFRSVHKIVAVSNDERASQGSAVALESRVMVTNCHVTKQSRAVGARIAGEIAVFTPIREIPSADLCVFETEKDVVPVRAVRSFASLRVGERVYAVGSPSGLENTFSDGVISGLREDGGVRYVQTTAPISGGSSGGGLFDEYGRLIGITTKGVAASGNLNFAVSIDMLE
jgi:TPR repeat protein